MQPTIDAFLEREAAERKAAGLAPPGEKKKKATTAEDNATVQCKICWDSFKAKEVAGMWCGHSYCRDCWSTFVTTAIAENKVRSL